MTAIRPSTTTTDSTRVVATQGDDPWVRAVALGIRQGMSDSAAMAFGDSVVAELGRQPAGDDPTAPSTAGGFFDPRPALFLQGLTFNQIPNIVGAAKAIVPGGEGFAEGKARAQQFLNRGREQFPVSGLVSEIAGGLAQNAFLPGGGVLGMSRSATRLGKLAEAQGALGGALPRMAIGAGEGIIAGGLAGHGESAPGSEGRGTAIGAGVGGVFGAGVAGLFQPILNAVARRGGTLAAKVTGIADLAVNRPRDLALDQVYHAITEILGQAPEDLIPVLQARFRLIPEQARWMALADYFPDNVALRRLLANIARAPGRAAQILDDAVRGRTMGAATSIAPEEITARLVNLLHAVAGEAPESAFMRRMAKDAREIVAGGLYERVKRDATPIVSADLAAIAGTEEGLLALARGREQVRRQVAAKGRDVEFLLRQPTPVAVDPATGRVTSTLTVADAYAMSIGFDSLVKDTQAGVLTGNALAKAGSVGFKELKHWVDGIASSVSADYAQAAHRYKTYSDIIKAIDLGRKVGAKTASEIQAELADLTTDAARNQYRLAYLDGLERAVKRSRNPLGVLDNPETKQRLAILFEDRPDAIAQLYQPAIEAEAAMAQINPLMAPTRTGGGSQIEAISRQEARALGQGAQGFRQPVLGNVFAAFKAVRERFADEIERETALAMTATGQTLFDMLRSLRVAPPPNLTAPRVASQHAGRIATPQPGTTLVPVDSTRRRP